MRPRARGPGSRWSSVWSRPASCYRPSKRCWPAPRPAATWRATHDRPDSGWGERERGGGGADYIIPIEKGRVPWVEPQRLATVTGRFTIRAAKVVWDEFWKPVPRRNHHDLWAMLAAGIAKIDGDLLPLMQNLQYFKDVLAAPRPPRGGRRPAR